MGKRANRRNRRIQNSHYGVNNDRRVRNIQEAEECMSTGRRGVGDRGRQVKQWWRNDKYYAELYSRHWEARKIIDIPVDDMFRKPFCFEGLDQEQQKTLENELIQLSAIEKLRNASVKERLFGGCVIVMGVAQSDDQELTEPLDYTTIQQGDLKHINVIAKNRCSVSEWYDDPNEANFDEPKIYSVAGQLVHESRLIVFDGDPLFYRYDYELNDNCNSSSKQGFGDSVLKSIAEDIFRAEGTRNAAYHLVNMASVIFTSADIANMDATKAGQDRMRHLENLMNQISVYRGAVMDKIPGMDTGDIKQHSASFGSVPELVNTFVEVLCAAADIPAVRFLGTSPSGLNTDGKSALENYYGRIETDQKTKLLPKLNRFLQVLIPSTFGDSVNIDDVFVEFKPLWVPSEKEEADTRKVNADTWQIMVNSGEFSSDELMQLADKYGLLEYENMQETQIEERDDKLDDVGAGEETVAEESATGGANDMDDGV